MDSKTSCIKFDQGIDNDEDENQKDVCFIRFLYILYLL